MKYGGTLTIIDDQGEVVFERELSADEMIEEILRDKKFSSVDIIESEVQKDMIATLEKNMTMPGCFKESGYHNELKCAHGIGHGADVHGCDGCCRDLTNVDGKLVDKRVPAKEKLTATIGHPGNGCGTCGSLGKRHKNGCVLAASKPATSPVAAKPGRKEPVADDFIEDGDPLDEDQFFEVKNLKEEGKPSMVIASKLGIRLIEVNKAFSALDYDYYIEHR